MKIRFSVIIATYNREKYLKKAIDSVLAQTYTDYEFIVVDDGSTDTTNDILQLYESEIHLIKQENQGSEMAYKAGVNHAIGEYIVFLDSDDFLMPHALTIYDKVISQLDSPPLIIGAKEDFEDGDDVEIDDCSMGCIIEVVKYRNYLSKDISIGLTQSRIVMKRTLFKKVQDGTGVPIERNLNDYRLILRAGVYGPCVIIKKPITLAYRQHPTQERKKIESMCLAILHLIFVVKNMKMEGKFYQHFDRYAYLGGCVWEWGMEAYRNKFLRLFLKIMFKGSPMIIVALIKKAWHGFYPPHAPCINIYHRQPMGSDLTFSDSQFS